MARCINWTGPTVNLKCLVNNCFCVPLTSTNTIFSARTLHVVPPHNRSFPGDEAFLSLWLVCGSCCLPLCVSSSLFSPANTPTPPPSTPPNPQPTTAHISTAKISLNQMSGPLSLFFFYWRHLQKIQQRQVEDMCKWPEPELDASEKRRDHQLHTCSDCLTKKIAHGAEIVPGKSSRWLT